MAARHPIRALAACAVLASGLAQGGGANAQTTFPDITDAKAPIQDCGSPTAGPDVCRVRTAVSARDAGAHLGGAPVALWREGVRLLIVARGGGDLAVAGSLIAPMARIDGAPDLWSLVVEIPRLDEAVIDIFPTPPAHFTRILYRGPKAPPAPVLARELEGRAFGDEIDSAALGTRRQLSIYLPPGFDPGRRYPTAYVADGLSVLYLARLVEPAILDHRLPPLVLIGLNSGESEQRGRDYLLGWRGETAPFEAHERFLLDEVMPRAEALYGAATKREDRLVTGKSNGGSWALDTALRHPDLFAQAAPAAIARTDAEGVERPGRPRLYIQTGLLDPFIGRSRSIAERAGRSGDELVFKTPVSGHGGEAYNDGFVAMLAWAFGRP